jgi:hypothetical protein
MKQARIFVLLCCFVASNVHAQHPETASCLKDGEFSKHDALGCLTSIESDQAENANAAEQPGPLTEGDGSKHGGGEKSWLVLASMSQHFWEMFENWLYFYQMLDLDMPVVLIAEDRATLEQYKNHEIVHVRPGNLQDFSSDSLDFDKLAYKKMMGNRPAYLIDILQAYGNTTHVIFTDVDMVWLEDPRPHLKGNFDMWAMLEGVPPLFNITFCCGFIVYAPTARTFEVLRAWEEELGKAVQLNQPVFNKVASKSVLGSRVQGLGLRASSSASPNLGPQPLILTPNTQPYACLFSHKVCAPALRPSTLAPHLCPDLPDHETPKVVRERAWLDRVGPLDRELFPSGDIYFGQEGVIAKAPGVPKRQLPRAVVIHNNWIVGKHNKVAQTLNPEPQTL